MGSVPKSRPLNQQRKVSDNDRASLKNAANVLTLALERHSAATRLKAERDRVVEAEKTRSYFFSSVSHDIRTPLNAIIGFSELLQAGGVPPEEAKQALKMIGWFATKDDVPTHAFSMTMKQILWSKSIVCTCPDKRKAEAVRGALEGPVTNMLPSSFMQLHPDCGMFLDPGSASLLANKG